MASWTATLDGSQPSKRAAFNAIATIANDHFVCPARVEIELIGESVYDEGGSFTSLTLTRFSAFDKAGQRLEPHQLGSDSPLEATTFLKDHVRAGLRDLEWEVSHHFHNSGNIYAVDLLEPPIEFSLGHEEVNP